MSFHWFMIGPPIIGGPSPWLYISTGTKMLSLFFKRSWKFLTLFQLIICLFLYRDFQFPDSLLKRKQLIERFAGWQSPPYWAEPVNSPAQEVRQTDWEPQESILRFCITSLFLLHSINIIFHFSFLQEIC